MNIAGEENLTELTPFTSNSVQAAASDRGTGSYSTFYIIQLHVCACMCIHVCTHTNTMHTVTQITILVVNSMMTSLICVPAQSCECYGQFPIPDTSSSSVVAMVIGWVLFVITLIACAIINILLIIMKQHPENKKNK